MSTCPFAVLDIIITYSGSANAPRAGLPHKWGSVRGGWGQGAHTPTLQLGLIFYE